MPTWNDEPCLSHDELGHNRLAYTISERIRDCDAPYVLGIGGTWGSGKTSFLRRIHTALGGEFDVPKELPKVTVELPLDPTKPRLSLTHAQEWRRAWFGADYVEPSETEVSLVWFNAWHHQMEANPLVALLHEIRQHFTLAERLWDKRGQVLNATRHAGLAMLDTLIKTKLNMEVKSGEVMKAFKDADAEAFGPLTATERFRSFFEQAIKTLVPHGRLVIIIDDLDRCEGDKAFALLEAMKLYLNANRCVFVVGLDREHLERNIAPCLKAGDRTTAREYLGKIFQNVFLLPAAGRVEGYIRPLVSLRRDVSEPGQVIEDTDFLTLLTTKFAYPETNWNIADKGYPGWERLVQVLDTNLPHNPRKLKSFVLSWKTYVKLLAEKLEEGETLDWEITLILHYLGQFEEPLFRELEEDASFYETIIAFCTSGNISREPAFAGIVPPYADRKARTASAEELKVTPRTFHITPLVKERGPDIGGEIERHLLFGSKVPFRG